METKRETHLLLADLPVRVLALALAGLYTLLLALLLHAAMNRGGAPRRPSPTARPSALPVSATTHHYLSERETATLLRWQPESREGRLRLLDHSRGAQIEQQVLIRTTSAREAIEAMNERLSRWGQEYQTVSLTGKTTEARLEYVLNLPGQPEQRGVALATRVRRGGRRATLLTAVTCDDRYFADVAAELARYGLRLR